jgi:nucleolin
MVTSEGNGEEESGSSSEMHIDLGGKKNAADTKGVKRKREDNGGDDEGNKKRKLNNGGAGGGNTKVRLGNLSFDLDGQVDEIKKQFADCGKIKNVEMITRKDGRFAGVAIIEFEDTDSAASAIEKHDQELYGRKMNLSFSTEEAGGRPNRGGSFDRPPSEKPEGCTTVFIGNLSYDITEDQVYEFFSDCGNIKQVRWPQGDFTGIGWVEFYDTNGPDLAIAKVGQNLLGRSIRVDFAAPRKPRF